jgi:hypothetical protein
MLVNWSNWIEAGIGGSSAASIEQVTLAYLIVSLLGPLSWILVVEICRRSRASQDERNRPGGSSGAGLRPALNAARLALPIAKGNKPF